MRLAASISVILISFRGIDLIEFVGNELTCCVMQLGRELGSRGPSADDRHVQLLGP